MKRSILFRTVTITAVLVLAAAAAVATVGNSKPPTDFHGVINDYTAVAASTGPWEVRGPWSLRVNEESGTGDFSAAVTMELSDFSLSGSNITASARMQHTHNITAHGTITPITGGFQLTGPVTITKDGGPAPAAIQGSSVVIDVTGGTLVQYSDISLQFLDGAANHFGLEPLHGVVRRADRPEDKY